MVINLKKINTLLMFVMATLVILSGYFIFFRKDHYDLITYNARKQELLTASSYSTYSNFFTLEASSTTLNNGKYSIVVTIDEVLVEMNQVKILLISGNEKTTLTDTLYPSKNILYADPFNLVPAASTTNDANKHGINLNFVSDDPVNEIYLFVGFSIAGSPITLYIQKAITL